MLTIHSGTTPAQRDRARAIYRDAIEPSPAIDDDARFILRRAETLPLLSRSRGWARLVRSTTSAGPGDDTFIDISPDATVLRVGSFTARGYVEGNFDAGTLRRGLVMGATSLVDTDRPFIEAGQP